MSISRITYPGGANETLLLSFDNDGHCTARSKDDLVVMGNYAPASDVAALGAKLYPANERDLQMMLQGLTDWREYLEHILNIPWSKKLSAEARQRKKDWQRGIKRIEAEIRRLKSNDTLSK